MTESTNDSGSTVDAPVTKMHADEIDTSAELVQRLIAAQFSQWADLPVTSVPSSGTDNAMFRLGDDLAVRMPRIPGAAGQVAKEQQWLPVLAPHLPLAIPVPVAQGAPSADFPLPWSVLHWLPGEPAQPERLSDLSQAAADLAHFLAALQRIDTSGGPIPGGHNSGRGVPLHTRDAYTRTNIDACHDLGILNRDAALVVWEAALAAGDWDAPGVWLHGDLLANNLLATDGRLSAVIDFGCMGVGDPACDLMPAWTTYNTPDARAAFRAALPPALAVDDAAWARGRAWSLSTSVIAIPYYIVTNPTLANTGRATLAAVFADVGLGG